VVDQTVPAGEQAARLERWHRCAPAWAEEVVPGCGKPPPHVNGGLRSRTYRILSAHSV
jgi:hypothetical protein